MMKNRPKYSRRVFLGTTIAGSIGFTLNSWSCTKSTVAPNPPEPTKPNPGDDENTGLKISGVILPFQIDVSEGMSLEIIGQGFAAGDQISFRPLSGGSAINVAVSSTTSALCKVVVPAGLSTGRYELHVLRGKEAAVLGATTLNVVFNANLPDREGMTIKGVVYASGKGLANVVVSDGIAVTKTDAEGVYYLPSAKKNMYVFVSIPANYEVATDKSAPRFFKRLERAQHIVEIKDFELTPVYNNEHVVMILGDMHLANRNQDISQFQTGFLNDVNSSIAKHKSMGKKVYALTLGDMSWETYWESSRYGLPEYLVEMNKINAPVFNTIGNHDNNPKASGDWDTADVFRKTLGPNYYSFNLGKIHYVVLDNVEYLNTPIGERNYNGTIVNEQMEWLKKDLAMIADKSTPIVVAMHINLFSNPSLSGQVETRNARLTNSQELINVLSEFSTVHIYSGHTHMNYNTRYSPSLMEHNIGAVCATWWWTGALANNHICKDGTPGGYVIWEANDNDMRWTYKSIGHSENYQFRAYDLNRVHLTKDQYAPAYTGTQWNTYAAEFANRNTNNEVLINVWNYDTDWKVEVKENGVPLPVTRVRSRDPLHIVSYSAKRLNQNAVPTADFVTALSAHMFKVKASSPTSTLEIKVTDSFGRLYAENMIRPKEISYSMT